MSTNISEIGRKFDLAAGDQTVKSLLAAASLPLYDGAKSIEIRCETTGPISVAVRDAALTALDQGRQLSQGVSWKEAAPRYGIIDLSRVRIYASGSSDDAFIYVRTF